MKCQESVSSSILSRQPPNQSLPFAPGGGFNSGDSEAFEATLQAGYSSSLNSQMVTPSITSLDAPFLPRASISASAAPFIPGFNVSSAAEDHPQRIASLPIDGNFSLGLSELSAKSIQSEDSLTDRPETSSYPGPFTMHNGVNIASVQNRVKDVLSSGTSENDLFSASFLSKELLTPPQRHVRVQHGHAVPSFQGGGQLPRVKINCLSCFCLEVSLICFCGPR
jgi:hypothetical protein